MFQNTLSYGQDRNQSHVLNTAYDHNKCKSQGWLHVKSIKVHILVTTHEAMKDLFWHTGYIWNEPRR